VFVIPSDDNSPATHAGLSPRPLSAILDGATLSRDRGVHLGRGLLVLLGVELPEVALAVSLLAAVLVAAGRLAPGALFACGARHFGSCDGVSGGRGNHYVPVAFAQPVTASLRQLCAYAAVGIGRVNVIALPTDLVHALFGVAIGVDLAVVALAVSLKVAGSLTMAVFHRAEELGPAGLRPNDGAGGFVGGIELGQILLEVDLTPAFAPTLGNLFAALSFVG
jgi:hypothetical protein